MRIGIDLGGTKIEGIAIDSGGRELARHRVSSPSEDYAATIEAIAAVVNFLENQTAMTGSVGVGIPGTLSPASGLIKNANSTCLIGQALDKDLAARLNRPVKLANDANCFAVSEATDGAGSGFDTVFGVILGTGVGGGIVFDNRTILTGTNAIAGEWGHNPLPWPRLDELPGPLCYCGQSGCIETFLSGSGLVRTYYSLGGSVGPDARQIANFAKSGQSTAIDALAVYEHRLSRALATVINVLDPDVIVLGGGLSNIERLYDNVSAQWGEWVFSDRTDTILRKNRHGDSSGVRGAAWLWNA